MVETRAGPRQAIEDRLRTEPTVWLSTVREDGRPHVVPVWFVWDGRAIDLFSKPNAQKVRNVRAHPAVMLALGRAEADWDVELIEGTASVPPHPTTELVPDALFDKYASLMARAALDRDTFVRTYSQPIEIKPTRFLGYGGKGWTDPSLNPDGEDDVSGHIATPSPFAPVLAEIRRVAASSNGPIDLLALD